MRRRILPLLVAAALMPAAARTVAAQEKPDHPIQFVVTGGVTVPAGDLKEFNDPGFHVAGSMIFKFAGFPLSLRPELSLTRLKQKIPAYAPPTTSSFYEPGDTLQTTQLLGALGNFELPLPAGLYLLAGVGALNLDTQFNSETKVTFNAGAGWRFQLGRLGAFVEARVGSASYEAGTFGYSSAQYIPVSFGIIF
jgi:hypothetical protein